MPSNQSPFRVPTDPNVGVWRYIPFITFISMLEYQGIFFPRANLLGDPYEGSTTKRNKESFTNWIKESSVRLAPEVRDRQLKEIAELNKESRKNLFVSCWHMNNHESMAMWNQYAQNSGSIAIKSTYNKLRDNFPENVDIGEVSYIDYEKEAIPGGYVYSYILYKRKSFEHERELRAVAWELRGREESGEQYIKDADEFGVWIPVDLISVIDTVYVSPTSPNWIFKLIEKVFDRYGIKDKIDLRYSKLDEDPLW